MPSNVLPLHLKQTFSPIFWRWRWWDRMQAIFWNIFYFTHSCRSSASNCHQGADLSFNSYLASKQSPWWWSMDTYKGVSSSIVTTTPLLLAKYFLIVFPHSVWPYNIGSKAAHVFKKKKQLKKKTNFLFGPKGFFSVLGIRKKSK